MYILINVKVHYNSGPSRMEKRKSTNHCPVEGLGASRSLFSWAMPLIVAFFFIIKGIGGDILCDGILPHTTLVTVKEHLVHLLLIILCQCLLINSEPDLDFSSCFFWASNATRRSSSSFFSWYFSYSTTLHLASTTYFSSPIRLASAFSACIPSCNSLRAFSESATTI